MGTAPQKSVGVFRQASLHEPSAGRARLLPSRRPLDVDPARQEPRPTEFMAGAHGAGARGASHGLPAVAPTRRPFAAFPGVPCADGIIFRLWRILQAQQAYHRANLLRGAAADCRSSSRRMIERPAAGLPRPSNCWGA